MQPGMLLIVLCMLVLFTAGMGSAQEGTKVLSPRPRIIHVDLEKDVVIVHATTSVYAQSIHTGKQLWSRPVSGRIGDVSENGILVCGSDTIQIYDIKTGQLKKNFGGYRQNVSFIGNTAWVKTYSDEVFTPEGKTLFIPIPGDDPDNANVVGWMPDGKTLLVTQHTEVKANLSRLAAYFWEPPSNQMVKAYELTSNDRPFLVHLSPEGKAVLYDKDKITLLDGRTGTVLRDLGKSGPQFTDDGYMLASEGKRDSVMATHLETGETIATLSAPGHTFSIYSPMKAYGKNWVFSTDEQHRYWLWPVEAGSEGRMIWESPTGEYTPGSFDGFRLPYGLFSTGRHTMKAFLLDTMECAKTWQLSESSPCAFSGHICAQGHRALASSREVNPDTGETTRRTHVFVPDAPEPIREIEGNRQGISPDGRYCAVQHPSPGGPVRLVDIDSGAECVVIAPESKDSYAFVVFSPDNRFMAVFMRGQITLVSLESGFPQRGVQAQGDGDYTIGAFSPDGNYFVLPGTGRARIFASESGEEVRTIIEPEKIANRYGDSDRGFLDTAWRFGKNLVGRFVTDNPSTPQITVGFAEGGKQLITMAEGQILRVWDIASGKLLRTLYTGLPEERNARGAINNELFLSENGAYAFAYNKDGYAPAELWEVATGKGLRRYDLPPVGADNWPRAAITDDGSRIYVELNDELYILPGKKKKN